MRDTEITDDWQGDIYAQLHDITSEVHGILDRLEDGDYREGDKETVDRVLDDLAIACRLCRRWS